jgi:ferredoxin
MPDTIRFRIDVDQDSRIGSGTCVSAAPAVFRLDDSGRAYVVDDSTASLELALEVAADCPSESISVFRPD